MVPDYPHKTFGDKRSNYCLLMEALAMEALPLALKGNNNALSAEQHF
jgi:hypothetical protein